VSNHPNSFGAKTTLSVDGKNYTVFSLKKASQKLGDISRLPYSLKVLLENLLRNENGKSVTKEDIQAVVDWQKNKKSDAEIAYHPARVVMQDFTGVPAVVDLAVMRDAVKNLGGNPDKINPQVPVDLVIDHSVQVENFGSKDAFEKNVEIEYQRNNERYEFLKWGASAFENFRVVPPGTGIIHQVNLEYLAKGVWTREENGETLAYCDTCVGTDSHTTMINGISVLGWGVGGIEAEAAMLGQPVTMMIPEVIGFKLTGKLSEGITATDLVLQIVQMLRERKVVGKFVEFYGPGLQNLSLADRATIANMAPEYGATCGFFPTDAEAVNFLRFTGREEETVRLVEEFNREQGMYLSDSSEDPIFTDTLELDMSSVEANLAGHKRPQDRITLKSAKTNFQSMMKEVFEIPELRSEPVEGTNYDIQDGDVTIAAITSCTNTSNPSVLIAAGLVAKKAEERGIQVKPWVKTSLAPGSQVVTEYLKEAGLLTNLEALGFHVVGYGCTTCIGNSGPLPAPISAAINKSDLVATSVLSGNRNFEGRISPDIKANYLASPPLVVAYAIAGTMNIDIQNEPLTKDKNGDDVYLKDLWPSNREVSETLESCLTPQMFKEKYSDVFHGGEKWQAVQSTTGKTYSWNSDSTYVQCPPYFDGMTLDTAEIKDITGARPLALLGQSVTTDHISPAGSFKPDTPAGKYLTERGVRPHDFNSYGSRRGNHEVMMRGTFANIRLRNEMAPGTEGGFTIKQPEGQGTTIFEASESYLKEGTPLCVIAGAEYGTGSSRDWAAKGTNLLGVKVVVAESYERIHRSNLIGMGVLPLQFKTGDSKNSLKLEGTETFDFTGLSSLVPRGEVPMKVTRADGSTVDVTLDCRLDTEVEFDYYKNGGILHYVLRQLAQS
jgi:aconitate hydratase